MKSMNEIQTELAAIIVRHAIIDGSHQTNILDLSFARQSFVSENPSYGIFNTSLCIVAQGEKEILLAQEQYRYSPANYLVASADLPITARVIQASAEAPYLSLKLEFTASEILDALRELDLRFNPKEHAKRALYVDPLDPPLLDAVLRLASLLDRPMDIRTYAPLYKKEILYRLLQSPHGNILGQTAIEGSHAWRIRDVIEYIMMNFEKAFHIEDLAEMANMSVASLHRHFKEVTAMSPIQYQKQLRLQEARRILLTESTDAADVAYRVGYESPSQFSREYARLFGASPIQDIRRIRSTSHEFAIT